LKRRPWNAGETALLLACFAEKRTEDVAIALGRTPAQISRMAYKLGLKKSPGYLATMQAETNRKLEAAGERSRFPKGNVPVNKGVKNPGVSPGRMAETQFRKGGRSRNWRTVGTVVTDTDGYLRVKIREQIPGEATGMGNCRVWPFLHRHTWEKANGPIPAGHALIFKDRDRRNTSLDNLELLSRADLMRRNTLHNLPPELVEVIQLRGVVNRAINRRQREKQDSGFEKPSLRDAGEAERRGQPDEPGAGEGGEPGGADHHQLRDRGSEVSECHEQPR